MRACDATRKKMRKGIISNPSYKSAQGYPIPTRLDAPHLSSWSLLPSPQVCSFLTVSLSSSIISCAATLSSLVAPHVSSDLPTASTASFGSSLSATLSVPSTFMRITCRVSLTTITTTTVSLPFTLAFASAFSATACVPASNQISRWRSRCVPISLRIPTVVTSRTFVLGCASTL